MIALLSLFTNTKEVNSLKEALRDLKVVILIFLILISTAVSIIYSIREEEKYSKEIKDKDVKRAALHRTAKDTNSEVRKLKGEVGKLTDRILQEFRINDSENLDPSSIKEIFRIDDLRAQIIANSRNERNRSRLTVQYFPKYKDNEKIYLALKELKFKKLDEIKNEDLKKSNFDIIEGKSIFTQHKTNAIYYGTNVDEENRKLVILTLLRAGLNIEGAFKFKDSKGRENLIQIVYSKEVNDSSRLEIKDLVRE